MSASNTATEAKRFPVVPSKIVAQFRRLDPDLYMEDDDFPEGGHRREVVKRQKTQLPRNDKDQRAREAGETSRLQALAASEHHFEKAKLAKPGRRP